jgi:hypothetical protein
MSQVELAFLTRPVVRETTPGMPMPTVPVVPVSDSRSETRRVMASRVGV